MSDEDIVDRIAQLFGHSYTYVPPRKSHWNPTYCFFIKSWPAVELMRKLYPVMGQRRQAQINRALESYIYKHKPLPTPKVTEDDVRAIKKRIAAGEMAKSIAQDFPISHYAIWDIRSGKTWSHVTLEPSENRPQEPEVIPLALDTDEKKLYWVAGLLEAEGSFMASAPSEPNRPRIALPMTDEDVVARAADILGVRYNALRSRNEKHKNVFRAMVRGRQAVEQMKILYPLMGKRRQAQIDKALASFNDFPVSQGEHNANAKINEEQARDIKARLLNYDSLERIAEDFGVSISLVREIKYGRTWKHVTP